MANRRYFLDSSLYFFCIFSVLLSVLPCFSFVDALTPTESRGEGRAIIGTPERKIRLTFSTPLLILGLSPSSPGYLEFILKHMPAAIIATAIIREIHRVILEGSRIFFSFISRLPPGRFFS